MWLFYERPKSDPIGIYLSRKQVEELYNIFNEMRLTSYTKEAGVLMKVRECIDEWYNTKEKKTDHDTYTICIPNDSWCSLSKIPWLLAEDWYKIYTLLKPLFSL